MIMTMTMTLLRFDAVPIITTEKNAAKERHTLIHVPTPSFCTTYNTSLSIIQSFGAISYGRNR